MVKLSAHVIKLIIVGRLNLAGDGPQGLSLKGCRQTTSLGKEDFGHEEESRMFRQGGKRFAHGKEGFAMGKKVLVMGKEFFYYQ